MGASSLLIPLLVVLLLLLLAIPADATARNIGQRRSGAGEHDDELLTWLRAARRQIMGEEKRRQGKLDTLQVAGSSLPDCTHACGSCTPCRLVMVSFVCASLEEAETCPMAYKCMCHSKSYPVP
ncbi:protein EPIDERMAL PATTERNING FACTOR 2 [Canna indica]|uniref:Epidermal patterning factor-like protein n=1 Tax=Canna indica TaxID=4628 RepID=A0AAQ3L3X1_9LILI|nr:protein EPIDERMAL PATTERNING FACTOR 2 [Canna indica]